MIVTSVAAPPAALTAAPARLALSGSGEAMVRLRNPGTKRIAVDVRRAGFALDLRGRPRIVRQRSARSAARWLTLRPARFTLGPHATARLHVSVSVPRSAAPGDHDALVLLDARPLADQAVSVRLRLGVVVNVRAPGTVVRRLRLGRLGVKRRRGSRALELVVVNDGNVTERLFRARVILSHGSSRLARVVATARELRPKTRGLLEFRLRTPVRGLVTARVVLPAEPGRPAIRRTFHVRL
jgi:hypothetical protein